MRLHKIKLGAKNVDREQSPAESVAIGPKSPPDQLVALRNLLPAGGPLVAPVDHWWIVDNFIAQLHKSGVDPLVILNALRPLMPS